ncbi:MAG TPA: serine/threonine-protein kinase [Gemmatimonadaceae bacterium]|nr:serine/threonine-protein kinase [Gemmatimonadaceae bacterium]
MASPDSSRDSDASRDDAIRLDPAFAARGLDVRDVLGVGGSSIVYRARDRRHERDVAIKVQRPDATLASSTERFAHEIRVAAALRHPHILPLFDSGTLADGRLFAVMPVAHGRPLRAMIDEGPLAVPDALRLAGEIAEALEYLHRAGYVHRDVKPENVLVESGHAVLTDFGIASPLAGQRAQLSPERVADLWNGGGAARLTVTGAAVGTPAYMSPEALLGDGSLDHRSDLYALGLVLYEMLAGELPHQGTSPGELAAHRLRHPLPSLRALRPDVPSAVDAIVARCTAAGPADRFGSAEALRDALAAIPTGATRAEPLLVRRARGPWSLRLAIVLLGMIAGVWWWTEARGARALDPSRVVVADLANDTGDRSLAAVGVLAGDVITAAITAGTRLTVVNASVAVPSRQQRLDVPLDSTLERTTRALVSESRAGLAVTGAYFRAGRGLDLVAEVIDTRSGRVLGVAGPLRASVEHPEPSMRALGDSVTRILLRRHEPPA